MIEESQN